MDGSATATRGLKEAIKIAKSCNARLRLLHVVNEAILIASDPQPASFTSALFDSPRKGGKVKLEGCSRGG